MQGQQSAVGSLPEVIGFDHGSTSSDASFDQQMCWTSVENPSSRLPDFLLSSSNTNMGHLNAANHQGQDLCRWDFGESSSRARQDDTNENDQKTEHEWPAPMNVCAGSMLISEQQYQSSSRDDVNQTLMIHNSGSHQIPQDLNMNCEVDDDDDDDDDDNDDCRVLEFPHLFKSGGSRNEQLPFASSSSNPFGPPPGSGGYLVEDSDGRPGCSLDGPRVSCKRKTLEGNAGQPSEGGSTSSPQHTESRLWHTLPAPHNASSSSNLTVTEETSFSFNPPEQVHPRLGLSFGQVAPVYLPSLDASGATDSSRRNFRMRINAAHQPGYSPNSMFSQNNNVLNTNNHPSHDSLRLPLPSNLLDLRSASAAGSMGAEGQPVAVHSRHSLRLPLPSNLLDLRSASAAASGGAEGQPVAVHSDQSLRLPLPSNLLDLRSASVAGSGGAEGQPVAVHVTSLRPISQSRWNGPDSLRNGAALSSVGSGSRNAVQHETSSSTSMPSNIADYPMFVPPNEVRSSLQSVPNWGLTGRNVDVSGNVASTSRSSSGTGVHSAAPSWVPHRSPSQYQRRMSLAEYVRQSLAADTVSGSENGIYVQSGASSSQEIAPTSGSGSQGRHSHSRSAMLLDRHTDGAFGIPYSLRNLAVAGEGRSRLVSEMRNVLDLVRRGEGLRFEDVMILDQSVFFGMADRYDRHRDMRLDVDNMSYEELLALEEHIGNVNTGLTEESIQKQLKQQNYVNNSKAVEEEIEPCCICQEEYNNGEAVGWLDCGHDFHAGCIKQWLMVKNLCPICKTTGLNK